MASEPNTTDAGIHTYPDSYAGHRRRSGQVHIQTHIHSRTHYHMGIGTEATWSSEMGRQGSVWYTDNDDDDE